MIIIEGFLKSVGEEYSSRTIEFQIEDGNAFEVTVKGLDQKQARSIACYLGNFVRLSISEIPE